MFHFFVKRYFTTNLRDEFENTIVVTYVISIKNLNLIQTLQYEFYVISLYYSLNGRRRKIRLFFLNRGKLTIILHARDL